MHNFKTNTHFIKKLFQKKMYYQTTTFCIKTHNLYSYIIIFNVVKI